MITTTRRWIPGAISRYSILALAAAASTAMAADGPSSPDADQSVQLEEIVVNARKRDERLTDIPESIAVLSADTLTKRGILTIEDVGRQTPNLQLNMRQDLTTNVVIRGIGAYGDVLGVGYNMDDVPNFTDQAMRLEDVDSVQILKGPQGTLYGGSSIGGLVRYVSKRPEFNWDGQVAAVVGNYSHLDISFAQNVPLIDGVLAMRASGYDVRDDGFIRNTELAIDANPLTDYGVRVQFLYKPTDALDALLTLRHSYIQNGGDMYVPVPGVRDYTYDVKFFQPNVNRRWVYGAVLELNDELSFAKLTSISSYTIAKSDFNIDITQSPAGQPGESYYTLPGDRPTEVSTQELRLTSPSTGPFQWLVGLYGAIIKNNLWNQLGATYFPDPAAPTLLYDFDTKRSDTAVFGNLGYHVGPWRFDAGVRLNRTVYNAFIYTEIGGPSDQHNSVTSKAALPKLSISYALPNDQQLYATVAKGEEPGAVNTVSTAAIAYAAQRTISYEVGTKGEALDHRLQYEAAAFYIHNMNQQYQTNLLDPASGGLVAVTSNIGDSRSYGIEADVSWQLTDQWRLGVAGGYLDAKWNTATYFGTPINGLEVPNAPHATASVNVAYSRPVFTGLRFDASFDMSYADAMWWDLPNTAGTKEPPHYLGGARVALGSDHRGWQVALRVSNLLDQKYWTEYIPAYYPAGTYPCAGCSDLGVPGGRRQFFASYSYKY